MMFGKKFIPCVCYTATRAMEATVTKLAEEGRAVIYEEKVFFQNGKVLKSLDARKAEEKAKVQAEKKAEKEAKKKAKSEAEVKEDFDSSDF